MYYRRKILLALLEAAGGELSNTDMEKLLFVFCMQRGENYYDFFPYRYGCFSFISYQDKRVLTKQGYLFDTEGFKLKQRESFLSLLKIEDQQFLKDYAKRTNNLRGDELIHHTYLNYPYYATRSEIKDRILNVDEQVAIDLGHKAETNNCLLTIGYEGLTIDAYINKLIQNNVAVVVDVRRNPISMKYGFSKTRLRNYLERAGIGYEHIPELGIVSSLRKNLETEKDYNLLFKDYAATTLPRCRDELMKIKQILSKHKRVALTCFEAKANSCHRHKITEQLYTSKDWNVPIVHIT